MAWRKRFKLRQCSNRARQPHGERDWLGFRPRSSTVAMIRVFSMMIVRARTWAASHFGIGYDYFLRNRFLVGSQSLRDLLLCAKDLFVAAMEAFVLAKAQG
jgi:hypothetical protein